VKTPVSAVAITAIAAAIVLLGITQAGTQHRLEQAQSANQAVAAVLAAPGARLVTSQTTVGGTVPDVVSARNHEAVVITAGMPAREQGLPALADQRLRCPFRRPDAREQHGQHTPVLTTDIQPGDHLGITIEPAGGSARPTTSPIAVLSAYV